MARGVSDPHRGPGALTGIPETEEQFLGWLIELAKLRGYLVYHTRDSRKSEPGFPDLVLAKPPPGSLIFLEVKTETGSVTVAQWKWLDALASTGVVARVVRPSDRDAIQALLG